MSKYTIQLMEYLVFIKTSTPLNYISFQICLMRKAYHLLLWERLFKILIRSEIVSLSSLLNSLKPLNVLTTS